MSNDALPSAQEPGAGDAADAGGVGDTTAASAASLVGGGRGADETQVVPATPAGPTGTSVLPAVSGFDPVVGGAEPGPPRWSARAQVRTPGVDQSPGAGSWDDGFDPPPRGLLVPVLVATCVLLLVSFVGLGAWLVLRARGVEPNPGPGTGTAVTGLTGTTAAAPTTTHTRTQTTPPPTTPVAIAIPDLRLKDAASATSDLEGLGFVVTRVDQPDPAVALGLVIDTTPTAGMMAAPGTTVVLIVSTGPATTPPTTPPPSTSIPTP